NNQAKNEAAAHEGMVAPLSDVKAACQQCYVADLDARAQVYADTLGVDVGSGSVAPVAAGSDAAPVSADSAHRLASNALCCLGNSRCLRFAPVVSCRKSG
ncbi:MAG: hypothetical protein AB1649_24860, partial [Chloroflexota bacterium]